MNFAKTLIATGAIIMLTSCDSKPASTSNPATAQPPPSTVPSAPTAAEQAQRDALAAYLGMWDAFVAAAATSDGQSSKLSQYATGFALSTLSQGLKADRDNGFVSKGSPNHNAQVSSVEPLANPVKVTIGDCSDSTNALKYRVDNGEPADDGAGGRRFIKATVEKQADGSWKVTSFGVQGVGTC
ncbi:hypothetical protein [Lentzea kentuckyensis]|uniref:hypothetical protein n=1 Tax=Lentzea kentuckyensis TaxID=360086 RepID=UPI001FE6F34B|nr:hypothetical protein [Lentzea kentuckyensis]